MNYSKWIQYFRNNRLNRAEPDWQAPISMTKEQQAKVLPSLAQFELGDGGGPASLIAHNAESFRGSSDEKRTVVDLWFEEEKEHSRLLGSAVKRFNGARIVSHWSFSAFCATRRWLGVRFELQVLLLTEIVSTAYYRLLRRHIPDVAVKQMCSLVLRDEAGHVLFHRDRLAAAGAKGFLWRLQFWICGHAAASMLWVNHGPAIRFLGGSTAEFFREVRLEISRFIRRLEARTVLAVVPPAAPLNRSVA